MSEKQLQYFLIKFINIYLYYKFFIENLKNKFL